MLTVDRRSSTDFRRHETPGCASLMATKLKRWCLGVFGLALLPLPLFLSLNAQDAPASQRPAAATTATIEAKGQVRTPGGVPVPGATLLLTDTASGREWVSWTDESG